MDQYGSFGNSKSDYREIVNALDDNGAVCFSWSPNGFDAYVIMLTEDFKKLGTLPFGGNPTGFGETCMFSILLRGSYWIDLCSGENMHKGYVMEKFSMSECDAENISILINGLRRARENNE